MSIPNLWNKIKGSTGIDKITIMYLFIVVGVGIACFGFGRLSTLSTTRQHSLPVVISGQAAQAGASVSSGKTTVSTTELSTESSIEKKYVASKNGKLYYPSSCKASNRIKEENRVWFGTEKDAAQAGYTPSPSCK